MLSAAGITDLIEKRTDVAFRIGVLRDSTLHARPIGHSRIRVVASNGRNLRLNPNTGTVAGAEP